MKINDNIYGTIQIENPIIIDLINTKPFQRLKNINQYGGVNFVYKESYQTSRFEHSIGVWYATMRLGGNLEEQVAALLHDIGHTAFSHMVDAARSDALENYHEFDQKRLEGYNQIENILAENKIELKNTDDYPIIKLSLPDVGTDRLDYAIRDFESVLHYNDNFGIKVLENVKLQDGKIIFTDSEVAVEFARRGNTAMYNVIYDPTIGVVYQSLTEILRDGLTEGWLTDLDLMKTDNEAFEIIQKNKDRFDAKYFKVFTEKYNVVRDDVNFDFKHIKLKSRYFDPVVQISDGNIKRVSEINSDFKLELDKLVQIFEERKNGVGFKIIY